MDGILSGCGFMALAIGRTDARTCTATHTRPGVVHRHDFAFDLVIFIVVEINQLAVIVYTPQRHHAATANFEATAASDAHSRIDIGEILRIPGTSITGCSVHRKGSLIQGRARMFKRRKCIVRSLGNIHDLPPIYRQLLGKIVQIHFGLRCLGGKSSKQRFGVYVGIHLRHQNFATSGN
jgi:hypothetical protein